MSVRLHVLLVSLTSPGMEIGEPRGRPCLWEWWTVGQEAHAQVALTVITALELEHLSALGGSLKSIAAAKAGIVKPGGVVVVARQRWPGADAALRRALEDIRPEWLLEPQWSDVCAQQPFWADGRRALLPGRHSDMSCCCEERE
jgi:hypothetical protein